MGIYNEILAPRYARFVQKLFSMKGLQSTKQAAGEVSLTVNMFSGVENRFLESWNRFGAIMGQAGSAGVIAGMRLRNPSGSNIVAVVEKITIANANGGQDFYNIRLGGAATDLTTVVATGNIVMDARQSNLAPTLILSRQTSPSQAINQIDLLQLATLTSAQVIWTDDQEITILPGQALQVDDNVVNQSINCGFFWRERFLEESERQ